MVTTTLTIPTLQDVIRETGDDPKMMKELLEKNPALVNIVMQESKKTIKYVRISEENQKNLEDASKNGIAEGVIIGLAIAFFFAILGGKLK